MKLAGTIVSTLLATTTATSVTNCKIQSTGKCDASIKQDDNKVTIQFSEAIPIGFKSPEKRIQMQLDSMIGDVQELIDPRRDDTFSKFMPREKVEDNVYVAAVTNTKIFREGGRYFYE